MIRTHGAFAPTRRYRPSRCAEAVRERRARERAREAAAERARLLEIEGIVLRVTGLAGVVVLAFFLTGCDGCGSTPGQQTGQFPQTPVGGPAQPCPSSEVVEVEVLDEQIQVPVKNTTVIIHYSDGTTQPVVTDQNGIASVCVRPGQTFTVEVTDTHSMTETHTPR